MDEHHSPLPLPPTNLSISSGQNTISINWTKNDTWNEGYHVYQIRVDGNEHYEHATETEFTLSNISDNIETNRLLFSCNIRNFIYT